MKKIFLLMTFTVFRLTLFTQNENYYIYKYKDPKGRVIIHHNFDRKLKEITIDHTFNMYDLDRKKWYQAITQNNDEDSCLVMMYLLMVYPDSLMEAHAIEKKWSKETIEFISSRNKERIEGEKNAVFQHIEEKRQDSIKKYYWQNIDKILETKINLDEVKTLMRYTCSGGGLVPYTQEERANLGKILSYLSHSNNADFKKYIFENQPKFECRELDKNCKVLIKMIYEDIFKRNEYKEKDIENIIKYNLSSLKDSLYPRYKKIEKTINEDPYNFERIERDSRIPSIKPIHIALAKFGDKQIEELIYQRIDNSTYIKSLRDGIQWDYFDINTKKSLQRALDIAKKQRKEYKNEVEERESSKGKGGWCGTRAEHSILTFIEKCNEKQELFLIQPKELKNDNGEYPNLSVNLKTIDYYIETLSKYIETLK